MMNNDKYNVSINSFDSDFAGNYARALNEEIKEQARAQAPMDEKSNAQIQYSASKIQKIKHEEQTDTNPKTSKVETVVATEPDVDPWTISHRLPWYWVLLVTITAPLLFPLRVISISLLLVISYTAARLAGTSHRYSTVQGRLSEF